MNGWLMTDDARFTFERFFTCAAGLTWGLKVPGYDDLGDCPAEYVYTIANLAARALEVHWARLKDESDPNEVMRICEDLFREEASYDSPEYFPQVVALVLETRVWMSGVLGGNLGSPCHDLAGEHNVGEAQACPEDLLSTVHCQDSRDLSFIPDSTVHLMVTSPPYNVAKDYDEAFSLSEYLTMLRQVFSEVYRVLVPGGRAVINVANLGRKPYVPLNSFIARIMLEIGYLMRGEIIWDKSASVGSSCAWGSFGSASDPVLRDEHEYLLVFSKGTYKLPRSEDDGPSPRRDTIRRDSFVECTRSIWRMRTEAAEGIGHPAPFPIELPRRCIEMYSFTNDVVLDPFAGSGTIGVAAVEAMRNYICVEQDPDYCALARKRVGNAHPYIMLVWSDVDTESKQRNGPEKRPSTDKE